MQPWKTRTRKTLLHHSKFLTVEVHEVELPDGRVIPDWPWLVTPDFVIVIAVTDSGDFLAFRQTKYAVDGECLAPVGGYLEAGENPLAAAQRELREETGYEAADWTSLGQYAVDGNRGAGTAHLYLATGARKITEPDADDLEEQEFLRLKREAVEQALHEGAFKVLPWAAGVALALLRIDR
ncbi:MAG: NUDIX hydrolase [Anaerolineae bacterium]|nr:NUDIX hydrolase [Anaerolineae bacterium]